MSDTQMESPQIVCLCGSTRFKEAFLFAQRQFTRQGVIVLTIGEFGHADQTGVMDDPKLKARLDELHLRKIDLADFVYVLNIGGYIGDSTRREIAYARQHNKSVKFQEGE